MTVRPTPGKRLSSLTNGLIAPVDRAEFETDPVSRSMLIEERRHTRLARQAVIGCGVLLIILVIWAAIAPVHQVVTGRGEIVPEGLVQPVEHLEGGIVRDILVAPGDPVAAGDALVILDSTATRAELQRAEARRDSLLLSIERQLSLADGGDLVIAGDTVLRRIADSQSDALESASLHRDAQLDVLRAEAAAKEAELRGVLLEQHSNERERAIVRRELADYEAALETGAISRRERDQVARELIALDRDQLRLASSAAALTETIAQTRARQDELIARLRQEAFVDVTQLETERAETEALIRQLRDRLTRETMTAPVDGHVHVVNVRGGGDVVAPAEVVLEIVPRDGEVYAQIEVPAERIGGIAPGMTARVKVLTFDFARFGAVDATVQAISPSSITKEDGTTVFQVDLRLAQSHVGPVEGGRLLMPGMTVAADVTTGSKTVLGYLLKPLRVLADRALTES